MELFLERDHSTPNATPGSLFADGVFLCHTLEDTVREIDGRPVEEWKVAKKTAIPVGRYRVIISRSERFSAHASKKMGREINVYLPEVLGVAGFAGIRIHGGNGPEDTEGCPLVGDIAIGREKIANCAPALERLLDKMRTAILKNESIWLTVQAAQEDAA
jgi:hypothetical protein